jgi:hypothetical protein
MPVLFLVLSSLWLLFRHGLLLFYKNAHIEQNHFRCRGLASIYVSCDPNITCGLQGNTMIFRINTWNFFCHRSYPIHDQHKCANARFVWTICWISSFFSQ